MRRFLNKNPGSAAQLSFVVQTPAVASSSSNNHELLCSRVGERFAKGLREFLALLLFILHVLLHHSQFHSYSLIVYSVFAHLLGTGGIHNCYASSLSQILQFACSTWTSECKLVPINNGFMARVRFLPDIL